MKIQGTAQKSSSDVRSSLAPSCVSFHRAWTKSVNNAPSWPQRKFGSDVDVGFQPTNLTLFSPAVPFWGANTENFSGLSPKRGCNPNSSKKANNDDFAAEGAKRPRLQHAFSQLIECAMCEGEKGKP